MKISVLTTSYNYEKYIPETIKSVLGQTFADFEYIIFDDGSTDSSLQIIKEYEKKDSRIKLYTHENNINKGLIETMKIAIKKCNGEYIIFVESDDVLEPNYIEEKLKILDKHPDSAIIFNKIEPFGNEQRVVNCQKYLKNSTAIFSNGAFKYTELLKTNIIPTFSCVMVKKDVIENIKFEFELAKCFDWYLWNYIIQNYKVVYLDKALTKFRMHQESMSCKPTKISSYTSLLKLSKRKYQNNIPYKMFESYKNMTRIEKALRPLVRIIDEYIYNVLYENKTINIITES